MMQDWTLIRSTMTSVSGQKDEWSSLQSVNHIQVALQLTKEDEYSKYNKQNLKKKFQWKKEGGGRGGGVPEISIPIAVIWQHQKQQTTIAQILLQSADLKNVHVTVWNIKMHQCWKEKRTTPFVVVVTVHFSTCAVSNSSWYTEDVILVNISTWGMCVTFTSWVSTSSIRLLFYLFAFVHFLFVCMSRCAWLPSW